MRKLGVELHTPNIAVLKQHLLLIGKGKDNILRQMRKGERAARCQSDQLAEIASERQMEVIFKTVGSRWRTIGRALGYPDEEVRDIVSRYRPGDQRDSDRLFAVLSAWKGKEGSNATIRRHIEACQEVGIGGIVELKLQDQQ